MVRFSRKNPNCDGGHCREPNGEVRVLPAGGEGNMILCKDCYKNEMAFRAERNKEVGLWCKFSCPRWEELEIYTGA